ncbi:family 16 glycosylhydrolase [Haloferula chungangensis]|uniref:Family 16 glycosylhydrolase n=1 Tax=Haloferula chungangensis TaxID=1048331 RepID=A0ABW2L4K0_9BACT
MIFPTQSNLTPWLNATARVASGVLLAAVTSVQAEPKEASSAHKPGPYQLAIEHIANLPKPPEGFRWAVNPDFSDEFSGPQLDSNKWHDKSPYWTNGRPPATFKAENVSVENGLLRIRNTKLDPTEGNDGKPGDRYSYAGGAVASKNDQAHFGYYETRMKASLSTMSSTFWLKNLPKEIRYIGENGELVREHHRQELDIIESVGAPTRFKDWDKQFNANTHYSINVRGSGSPPNASVGTPKGGAGKIAPSAEDFHTYGLWWIDATTMKFYYDGKFLFTINPSTAYNPQPFSRPMYMHLVTETYDWEPGLPTDDDLADPGKNSTYYDWVRSYILVRANDIAKPTKKSS